ncbi:MAG: CCDC34 family protein [Lachnospiraceae bacterium]|nr:CCDC34 family protein [Lachnospiraceae bacterium]
MWDLYKFLLKWMFILGLVLIVGAFIYDQVYSVVDPEGYQVMKEEDARRREQEERDQKAAEEAEEIWKQAEAERRANMWCKDENYDRFVKGFNDRHPDHPIGKNDVDDSYGTVEIMFNGYKVFYKEYNVDDGPHAGENASILNVHGEFYDSTKKLNEEDKKVIKAAYMLNDEEVNEVVNAFSGGTSSAKIGYRKYRFYGNDGAVMKWSIEYQSTDD